MNTTYTPESIQEFLKCSTDPVHFISNHCYIEHPIEGKILFKLRDYQIRIIRAFQENRFSILASGRQIGKSKLLAAYAYWWATFKHEQSIMIASHKLTASKELLGYIKFMYENSPTFLRYASVRNNQSSIKFDNGSSIHVGAISEYLCRGRTLSLFIGDEVAFANKNAVEGMFDSIYPCLIHSSSSKCILSSTRNPKSDNGKFFNHLYEGALAGTNSFKPISVTIDEIPGRDIHWQNMMITQIGKTNFENEYLLMPSIDIGEF